MATPDMIRILNTTTHAIVLPNLTTGKGETAKTIEGPRLIPGGNNVRRDLWDGVLGLKTRPGEIVRGMVDAGELREDNRKGAVSLPEGPEPPKTLADFKPKAALAMIDGTGRVDVLSGWLRKERRKPIREALTVKIAALGGSVTPDGLKSQARADLPDPKTDDEIETDEGDEDE